MAIFLKYLLFGISTVLAMWARMINGGFGFVVFLPIYLIVSFVHIFCVSVLIPTEKNYKLLKVLLPISHFIFLGFLLFSVDAGDSEGGLTVLVALRYYGIDLGFQLSNYFDGITWLFIHIFLMILFLILDIFSVIKVDKYTKM